MLPYQVIGGGSFTSDATVARQIVQVNDRPDFIIVRNRTSWGNDAALAGVETRWYYGMAQDSYQSIDQAITSGALSSEAGTTNGFRVYSTANPPSYSALATSGTDITNANPAVATMSNTGFIRVGDIVRVTDSTSMLQIAGYDFSVTAVTANTNITLNLDASGFAAAATAGNIRLIIPNAMYPRLRYIVPLGGAAGITQATNAVVSCSVAHSFSVGEKVMLRVPSQYGMVEANNKVASVLSVTTYTVTLDLDTSAYTAFTLPTSAVYAAGATPAQILPAGAGPQQGANPPIVPVTAAYDNRNQWVIDMGSNIITATSEVYDWMAIKYDIFTAS